MDARDVIARAIRYGRTAPAIRSHVCSWSAWLQFANWYPSKPSARSAYLEYEVVHATADSGFSKTRNSARNVGRLTRRHEEPNRAPEDGRCAARLPGSDAKMIVD